MSMMTTFTQELSARLLNLLKIETAPVFVLFSCGLNATSFIRSRTSSSVSPILENAIGSGYSFPSFHDTTVLETQINNQVQAFGASIVLRKRNRDEFGNLSFIIDDEKKSQMVQELDRILNSVIAPDGLLDSSQEIESGSSILVALVASPKDGRQDCPFAGRLFPTIKRQFSNLRFHEIEATTDNNFLYQGRYGVQGR